MPGRVIAASRKADRVIARNPSVTWQSSAIRPETFRDQHGKYPEHASHPPRTRQSSLIRRPGRIVRQSFAEHAAILRTQQPRARHAPSQTSVLAICGRIDSPGRPDVVVAEKLFASFVVPTTLLRLVARGYGAHNGPGVAAGCRTVAGLAQYERNHRLREALSDSSPPYQAGWHVRLPLRTSAVRTESAGRRPQPWLSRSS